MGAALWGRGLSPHARPACAGEPHRARLVVRDRGVYPRMRGGACPPSTIPLGKWGLSPHALGSHLDRALDPALGGSIPACAGEPEWRRSRLRAHTVYPRMRGGAGVAGAARGSFEGLSPHARGSRALKGSTSRRCGSIPACAGEPGRGWARGHVHPGLSPHARGSPAPRWATGRTPRVYPRMRGGAGERQGQGRHRVGSIPACAGEPW